MHLGFLVAVYFILTLLSPGRAYADDAGNISACVEAAGLGDRELDEFDVQYEGSFLGFSVAKWNGVECEVKLELVFNLTIEGERLIVELFAGKEAQSMYEKLEKSTDEAVATLKARVSLLKSR